MRKSQKLHTIGLVMLALIGPLYAWSNAAIRSKNYFLPRAEAAETVLETWRHRYPDVPLRWVGGMWQENGLLGFYGDPSLRILPATPDSPEASANAYPNWETEGGVLLCPGGWLDGMQADSSAIPSLAYSLNTACAQQARDWLNKHGHQAPPIVAAVHRSGFAFPDAPAYAYVAYVYLP